MQLRHHCNKVLFFLFLLVGISVRASTWEPPLTVSTGPSSLPPNVKIVCDGEGNAATIWAQFVGADLRIHTSYRPVGGLWETPTVMDVVFTASEYFDICMDETGNLTADKWVDSSTRARAKVGFNGTFEATATTVDTTALLRSVCMSNSGIAFAAWTDSNTGLVEASRTIIQAGQLAGVLAKKRLIYQRGLYP